MKKSIIFIIITAASFSILEPVGSLPAFQGANAFSITALRFLIGCLILLPYSVLSLKKKQIHLDLRDWLTFAGLSIVIFVSMDLLQLSVQVVREAGKTPANVAIIFSSSSLFTILLSRLILHETFDRRKLYACVLCIIGLLFCVNFSGRDGWISSLFSVLAAASFSLYTVLVRKFSTKCSGCIQAGFSFLIGGILQVSVLLLVDTDTFANIGPVNFPLLICLGIVVTGIGYLSYFLAIEHWNAMAGSFVFFVKPVMTPFSVWLIKGNDFAPTDWKILVAVMFVVAGSILAVIKPKDLSCI